MAEKFLKELAILFDPPRYSILWTINILSN